MNFINRLKHDPHRPILVTYAVFLVSGFLTLSLLLTLIRTIIYFVYLQGESSVAFDAIFIVLGYLLLFIITSQIAAGKNWARWLLLIGFAFSLLNSPSGIQALSSGDTLSGLMSVTETVILAVAVAFLFQRTSSAWFKRDKLAEDKSIEDDELETSEFNEVSLAIQSGIITAEKSKKRWTLILMISSQLISALLLVPWLFLWPVLLSFDILPGWRYAIAATALILLLLYPLWAITLFVVAWIKYAKQQYKWASVATIAPLFLTIVLLVLWTGFA